MLDVNKITLPATVQRNVMLLQRIGMPASCASSTFGEEQLGN